MWCVWSGTLFTGMGNKFDKGNGHPLPAGSYAFIPARMRHYAWVDEPTTLQVQGNGPWQLIPVSENGPASGPPNPFQAGDSQSDIKVISR